MALFVHLTPAKNSRSISRAGLRSGRGVFCVPMLRSYSLTHQWLRELRRWSGQREYVAIDFRVPDEEMVAVGHYGRARREVTAAAAVELVRELADPLGFEVVVPRAVSRREVHRIRHVKQVCGWRYAPGQHGVRPCPCPVCLPIGAYGSASIRARY
ncbi:hypothetical protein AB5J62_20650 [Amycolatopsis sp. cg5]|uniref:hypothetical protein n=1 Tax=Amycolatopsis sp. cg5 TaxID=3238802 RepID=UPI0035233CDA